MNSVRHLNYRSGEILVIGDLHFDFWVELGQDPFAALPQDFFDDLDAVIVAGDLTNKPKPRWPQAIRWLSDYVAPDLIHVMPGNHDYYDFRLDGDLRLKEIAEACGAHFCQCQKIRIASHRILCATLWTDMRLGRMTETQAAVSTFNDYRKIRLGSASFRKIRPDDTVRVHGEHLAWLSSELEKPHDGGTTVVTHHAPVAEAALGEAGDALFASDLSGLIAKTQPERWLFAHTHRQFSARSGATHVKNVSLGYPDEVTIDEAQARIEGCRIKFAD